MIAVEIFTLINTRKKNNTIDEKRNAPVIEKKIVIFRNLGKAIMPMPFKLKTIPKI